MKISFDFDPYILKYINYFLEKTKIKQILLYIDNKIINFADKLNKL